MSAKDYESENKTDEILKYETEITEFYDFPGSNQVNRYSLDHWIGLNDWIAFTIADECRKMKISTDYLAFIYSINEALRVEKEDGIRKRRRSYFDQVRGMMYQRTNQMFLNFDNHDTRSKIRHTIIHELIHKKFPSLRHGKRFSKMVEAAFSGNYDMINSSREEILFWRKGTYSWYCEKVSAIGPYEIKQYSNRWIHHYYRADMIDLGWIRSKIVPIGFYEMMNIRNPGYLYLSW